MLHTSLLVQVSLEENLGRGRVCCFQSEESDCWGQEGERELFQYLSEMATHSSILAWRIPWTEDPGRLYSPEACKESDMMEHEHTHTLNLLAAGNVSLSLLSWQPWRSTVVKEQSWRLGAWQDAAQEKQGIILGHIKLDIPVILWATQCSPAMWNFLSAFWFNIPSLQMQFLWLSLRFLTRRRRKMAFSKNLCPGDFCGVQWLDYGFPMQGAQVQFLVWERGHMLQLRPSAVR